MPQRPLARVVRRLRSLLGSPGQVDLSDRLLLERFVTQRDDQAFAALLLRHGPMVHAVCRRLLPDSHQADDAFQAVFVVLVRRAHVVDRERSLASWLYGVAYRVALKARGRAARQHALERQADDMDRTDPDVPPDHDPATRASLRELRGVIDDELNQLPDKYRAPLVLCYLEGKTNEQAARELGWPAGSMSMRLEKGRELLRQRLRRRGVTLPAAVLAVGLAEQTASAALPPALAEATLRTAASIATASGHVPAAVLGLADPVVRGMVAARVKVAALVLVSLTILGGAGAWSYFGKSAAQADPAAALADGLDRRIDELQPTPAERRIDEVGWAPSLAEALKAARAIDLGREDPRVRDRYGKQAAAYLQARRLAEAGVPVITLDADQGGWDTHSDNFNKLRPMLPRVDHGLSTLIEDLHERGLDRDVLVVMWGEFGRSPKISSDAGRDHWPEANYALFAGGGMPMGQVIGGTDARGARPTTTPYGPQHVLATIYRFLGIDPEMTFPDHNGRPIYILDDRAPIKELI
ncbi:MAG: sigma-70 family RNA polymerase sigma factor [Gemmataceae bacterium]